MTSSNERQARWNDKHLRGEETHALLPSSLLPEAIAHFWVEDRFSNAPPSALDVACGAGRHALFLAERGFSVFAVDFASAGLDLLRAEAARRGLLSHVTPHLADLESGDFRLPVGAFDVVCDVHFLSRPLFPALFSSLRRGGLFVAAIHVESEDAQAPHRFLLRPGELRDTVVAAGLEVLISRERSPNAPGAGHATAEIIARRP